MEAVKFVKVEGRITNKEYQKKFDLKKRQSTDDLKELEIKGILARVGTTGKGTYYILKGAPKGRKGH
jgi:ATP-dependent DNA helicase RecG